MKTDIILAGVGGQGILTIAATIGTAALQNNLHIKQSEVHGMSQRGGDVQSHLRISDKPIASDLIGNGSADIIIAVEPMEGLRYLPFLSKNGWLVTNSTPFINISNYPDNQDITNEIKSIKNHIIIDADAMAKEIKASRSSNIVVLGAASPFLNIKFEDLEKAIRTIFERKGEEIVNINLKALKLGREFAETQM
ncbi:MAG: indolepyruvate oxidoreductase subunit beta [Bacteroidales bacterium]|nr:indolepyruvate oxidoreductase subunit beta [Bacteroidales bacterium]MBN2756977.1 indolepyruvate oxidoreductase subunit beta [Bacteroidales bacterium]